ncbi:hypothetical protein BG004_001722 [Podila humilis]|nr:hypothetical protein BG004_001722 [Podila humilis]
MTPCLLFTKIASTINWTQFKAFWPIPVFYLLFSTISWAVARVGSRILRFSKDEEKFVIASILFSNTNSLPMALLQSLAFSAAGSRLLRDENDTKIEVAASLLVPTDKDEADEPEDQPQPVLYHPQPKLPAQSILINIDEPSSSSSSSSRPSDASILTIPTIYRSESDRDDMATPKASDSAHYKSSTFLANPQPVVVDHNSLHPLSTPIASNSLNPGLIVALSPSGSTRSFIYQTTTTAYDRVRQVLTPPLMTALIALVIGLVPYLHQLFMSPDSVVYRFLIRPVQNCGDAAIPMILLCLGAQVVNFAAASKSEIVPPTVTDVKVVKTKRQVKIKTPSRNDSPTFSSGQTGLGIYTTPTAAATPMDESSGDEDQSNSGPDSRTSLAPEPYGEGIAILKSNASSSATLLHFSNTGETSQGYHGRRREGSSSSQHTITNNSNNNNNTTNNNNNSNNSNNNNNSRRSSYDEDQDDDEHDDDETLPLLASTGTITTTSISIQTGPNYRIRWMTPIPFILFSRMLLVPAISLPAILFHPESLSPILTMDPTFSLALVLISAAPTAINMIQICQIKGFFEHEMAAVLFWSYCVLGIPCVLGWSLVGLWAAAR